MQQKTPPAYQALEDIKKARELLGEGPHRWTKHFYARTKEGGYSFYDNNDAYCFCASGAIYRSANGKIRRGERALNWFLSKANLPDGLSGFNDAETTTYENVLSLFDHVISSFDLELKLREAKHAG